MDTAFSTLALQAAQEAKARGIRCFSLGDVVHNPSVAQRLRDAGVQKVDEVSQAQGGLLILRSHPNNGFILSFGKI